MANRVYNDGAGVGLPQVLVDNGDGTYSRKVVGKLAPSTAAVGEVTLAVVSISTVTATIPVSGTRSGEIDLGDGRIITGVRMPAKWTTANLSFQAGATGALMNLYDDTGTPFAVVAGGNRSIQLTDPTKWVGVRYVRIRSGTHNTTVAQTAARSVVLVMGL